MDPETGTLVFRSEEPVAVRPGGENVLLKLRRIPEATAKFGQDLELRLLDADNEEILERKTVTLKIDLDEWFCGRFAYNTNEIHRPDDAADPRGVSLTKATQLNKESAATSTEVAKDFGDAL